MARRKIGAFSKKGGMDVVSQVAGALAGNVGANMLSSSLMPTMDGKTKGAILLAGGVAISMMVKDPIIKSVGLGVALNGGTTLLGPTGFAVINGVGRARRIRGIGRNGRYVTDGIARPNAASYSVRPGAAKTFGQQGVIAGTPYLAPDFNATSDFDAKQDFR